MVKESLPSGKEINLFLSAYDLESVASVVSMTAGERLPLFSSLGDTGFVLSVISGSFGLALQLESVHVLHLDTQDFDCKPTMGATFDAAEQATQDDMLTWLMGQQGE